jgi:hypothetical protein
MRKTTTGDNEDDVENEDDLVDMFTGMKRKVTTRTWNIFPSKVAKTIAQAAPSTTALNAIDDHCLDLTLIDTLCY